MICKRCGNKKDFTMIREIAYWDSEDKMFKDTQDGGDEFYVCDTCMSNNEEGGHIDTEGDY